MPAPRTLGRLVEHDERSRDYPFTRAMRSSPTVPRHHRRYGPVFDQGDVSSCTGNALAGALMTGGLYGRRLHPDRLTEANAVAFYSAATALDGYPGTYPPDDTGSSGLAVCKAGVRAGYLTGYTHIFGGVSQVVAALRTQAIIVGVNWYEGFDTPDASGLVSVSGDVRGGHEFVLEGYDPDSRTVDACNSWGPSWGHRGHFRFSWDDLGRLLDEQGDATVPTI